MRKIVLNHYMVLLTLGAAVLLPYSARATDSSGSDTITFYTGTNEATATNNYITTITAQQQACLERLSANSTPQQDYETCMGNAYGSANTGKYTGTDTTGTNPYGSSGYTPPDNTALIACLQSDSQSDCLAGTASTTSGSNLTNLSNNMSLIACLGWDTQANCLAAQKAASGTPTGQ